jgi:hypothetical protein
MGILIYGFHKLGEWIDFDYPSPFFNYHTIFILLGVGLALYNTIRQVNNIDK